MKKLFILIIIVSAVLMGCNRHLFHSNTDRTLDTINIGAYNNDPSAEKIRTSFAKTNALIRAWNTKGMDNISATEMAILDGALVSTAELNRLIGTTSAVQTQLNARVRSVDSTGNAAGNYVTRKALVDTTAIRDTEIDNIQTQLTDTVVFDTVDLWDEVIISVGDTTVTPALGKMVYKTSDNHFYGCRALTGHKWYQLD